MNKLEKDIKSRLENAQSLEGVNADELWSDIVAVGIVADEPNKKRRAGFFWFMIGFLAFTSGVGLYFYSNGSHEDFVSNNISESSFIKEPKEKAVETPSEIDYNSVTGELENTDEVTPTHKNTHKVNSRLEDQNNKIKRQDENSLEQENNPELNNATKELSLINHPQSTQAELTNLINVTNDEISLIKVLENELPALEDKIRNDQYGNLNSEKTTDNLIPNSLNGEQLETISIPLSGLMMREVYLDETSNDKALRKRAVINNMNQSIPFKLYAGTNILRDKYSDNSANGLIADSMNESLSIEPGISFGGQIQWRKWNNWAFNIGAEYHMFKERFDKIIQTDTTVLIGEGGQTTADAINVRTIRHYNQLQVVTIPVEFVLSKEFQKLKARIGIGASYSIITSQNGRRLIENELVGTFSSDTRHYSNYLSLRITPEFAYNLNEKTCLLLSTTMSFQSQGKSDFIDLKSSSLAIMPSVGVSFNY